MARHVAAARQILQTYAESMVEVSDAMLWKMVQVVEKLPGKTICAENIPEEFAKKSIKTEINVPMRLHGLAKRFVTSMAADQGACMN